MENSRVREMSEWLTMKLSEILNIPSNQIDPNEEFVDFGLTSIAAVCLLGDIERKLGRTLSPTLTYEHSTINSLSRFLADV
jgi:acyl carrier protein